MRVLVAPPLHADVLAWQEHPDLWTLTVVCKATYDLAPGTSHLAKSPEPIHERDRYWGDDPKSSVHAPSDLAPFKLRPEVMLVGTAVAKRGEPVQSLVVRLVVGEIDKAIEVLAPRSWMPDLTLREGAPWTRTPLRYERAAGGEGSDNPVGVPPNATDANGRSILPQLQRPGQVATEPGEVLAPIGFGPIAPTWPARRGKLRGELARRAGESLRGALVGPEVDATFFQSAPVDQRVAQLLPDQEITLENLHPEHERLETRLSGVTPYARLERVDAPAMDVDLVADTLWIDADRSICTLVWRGQAPIQGPDDACLVRIGVHEEKASPIRWASSSPPETFEAEDILLHAGYGFRHLVELLWFDPDAVPSVRESPAWRRLLVRSAPSDRGLGALRDQTDLERILTCAPPTSDLEAPLFLAASERTTQRTLCVVAGQLELPLDDARMLEVLSSAAGSLAPGDEALEEVIRLANEMKTTALGASPDLAAIFCARLREAWARSARPLPLDVLEANARRVLLDERAFQRRVLAGEECIRARLTIPGHDAPVAAYLPAASARALPLFASLSARAIAEIGAGQEDDEPSGVALRIVALARVVARPRH
jgi:hypothetical protein